MAGVEIRSKVSSDDADCADLARLVYEHDGYPPFLGGGLEAFLDTSDALGAWVAVKGPDIVGHVALTSRASDEVLKIASETLGIPAERLGVVARLFVSPAHRRVGIGDALLRKATEASIERGRQPVLDVVMHFLGAIALYEGRGWLRLGTVKVHVRDGLTLEEHVYALPPR